jgi:hypothetical protein
MTSDIPSISIVLPLYKGEDAGQAREVIAEIEPILNKLGVDYEFLTPCQTSIGKALKEGIATSSKEYIGLYSAYNQIDPKTLGNILPALKNADLVIGYIGNPQSRSLTRRVYSRINVAIVNILFGLRLKYYHFYFFRTSFALRVPVRSSGHAALIESGVWLVKSGVSYAQVPIFLKPHNFPSKSGAFKISTLMEILMSYMRLFISTRILRKRIIF